MRLVEEGEGEWCESLVNFFVIGYGSHGIDDVWLVSKGCIAGRRRCWWLAVVFVGPSLVVELREYDLAAEESLEVVVGLVRFVGVIDESGVEFVWWWFRVGVKGSQSEVGVLQDG